MLSLITPIYLQNQEQVSWLRECLISMQNQTFTDWEAILIDDKSPADLTKIKQEFTGGKFRWFDNVENTGPSKTRNTGVRLAEGEAILAVDADDILPPTVLERLYTEWVKDKTKIVYGDLQLYEKIEGVWQPGQIIILSDYNFQKSLKTTGAIPVTALHSIEAHYAAGGWDEELTDGYEDVEKWIGCGRAGFCGKHINFISLLYRRHEFSRFYNLRFINRQEAKMKAIIETKHKSVYEGRYDMGCCGGGSTYIPPTEGGPKMGYSSSLDDYPESDLVFFRYNGSREASFGIKGSYTGKSYLINGRNFEFPVHKNDAPTFRRSGRGLDFTEVPAPITVENLPPPVVVERISAYKPNEPKLSILQRLDEIAQKSVPVEVITRGAANPLGMFDEKKTLDLNLLQLPYAGVLTGEWSIEDLAKVTNLSELTRYPGIGNVRAENIIKAAKEFVLKEKV